MLRTMEHFFSAWPSLTPYPTKSATQSSQPEKSFLTSRAGELRELRKATPAKSFGALALERVRNVVADELRWIQRLERNPKTRKET